MQQEESTNYWMVLSRGKVHSSQQLPHCPNPHVPRPSTPPRAKHRCHVMPHCPRRPERLATTLHEQLPKI